MNRYLYNMFSITLILALMLVALPIQSVGAATPTELFISEYIEGSSLNKAIEIFNGTGSAVDLAADNYSIAIYFNGSTSAGTTIALTGTVADEDVYVVADDGAAAAILAVTDQTSTANFFNGDDVVVLRKNGVVVDAFGQIGTDPGSQWVGGGENDTLRRAESVCAGDTNPDDSFDASVEWVAFAQDTFDGLGAHTANCDSGPLSPVINEFVFNHTGTDTNEYVEFFGEANTDYSSLTILQLEGDTTGAGVIDTVVNVGTTDAGGFWTTGFLNNEFENGAVTLLLVEGFTGSDGADLDTNNDGVLDSTPWSQIVDDVAVSDGGAGDRQYSSVVLAPGFGGSSFPPGGASRIPNGTDTDNVADWTLNDFDLAGIPGFTGTPVVGEALNTPGATNELFVPPPEMCGDPITHFIHEIQGSGLASPLDGMEVAIEGIVVGDFQNNASTDDGDLNGFYVQEEDAEADADPATSEGIFVFAPGSLDVSVGDHVRVRGTVDEFFNLTEITSVSVLLQCSTGNALPTAAEVTLPVTSLDDFEKYEGMFITFPQALVISEYFNYDRFGEIVLGLPLDGESRFFTPTGVVEPGADAQARAEAYRLRRITLDDGLSTQNPSFTRHPDGDAFALDNRFRGGDTVQNATGVLDFSFGLYRIQPTEPANYTAVNPRPAQPEDVGGNLKVASFNVLNYFLTIDSGPDICGPAQNQDCRGADSVEEFERQRAKIMSALSAIEADVFGLIEMENTTGVEPLADIVAGLNDQLGAGTYAFIDTGTIGTDAIKVGIIYKPATVTPLGPYAILDSSVDPRFDDDRSRPVLAQTFQDNTTGGIFTVAVNHLKSKGSGCGPGDDDPIQGNCNLTRTLAAEALVDWLASDPTGSGDEDFLITGDLNAYDKEDPIDEVREGADDTFGTGDDYTDLLFHFIGEFAYSFVFDGQAGYLDHGLAIQDLLGEVTGATVWHINADEPDLIDYDTTFKSSTQDAIYAPDAYRSSDHDPVIVGLDLVATCNGVPATIIGTPGDDTINGTDSDDVIVALAGNDVINGGDGDDIICGDGGNDTLNGGDGDDILIGSHGDDILDGGDGDDTLVGGAGDDSLTGDEGDDLLDGGNNDDELFGGNGDDTLTGGAGADSFSGGEGENTNTDFNEAEGDTSDST